MYNYHVISSTEPECQLFTFLGLVEHRYEIKELEQCVGSCPNDCDVTKMDMVISKKRRENDIDNEQGMIMWWEELVRSDPDLSQKKRTKPECTYLF